MDCDVQDEGDIAHSPQRFLVVCSAPTGWCDIILPMTIAELTFMALIGTIYFLYVPCGHTDNSDLPELTGRVLLAMNTLHLAFSTSSVRIRVI